MPHLNDTCREDRAVSLSPCHSRTPVSIQQSLYGRNVGRSEDDSSASLCNPDSIASGFFKSFHRSQSAPGSSTFFCGPTGAANNASRGKREREPSIALRMQISDDERRDRRRAQNREAQQRLRRRRRDPAAAAVEPAAAAPAQKSGAAPPSAPKKPAALSDAPAILPALAPDATAVSA